MTAPAATARQTPTGIRLEEGHPTKITFARFPAINFWEISVSPGGVDGGDAVDLTDMFAIDYRVKRPRVLKEMTDGSAKVHYDPGVLTQIMQMINIEDVVTVRFRDGTTWAKYGYLKAFEPDEISEGEPPEASIEIVFTNYDPAADVEAGPTVVSVTGT